MSTKRTNYTTPPVPPYAAFVARIGTVGYGRISDDREGEEAGVTRQTEGVVARIDLEREWTMVAPMFVDNDMSATSGEYRHGFEEIMTMVEAGTVQFVVAWTANRFLRSRSDRLPVIELFARTGTRLVAVRGPSYDFTTADGRLMAGLIGSIDAAESERTGERVRRAAATPREGTVPRRQATLRLVEDRPLRPRTAEAEQLKIAATAVAGGRSLNSEVVRLNTSDVPKPQSGQWSAQSLRSALLAPRMAGLRGTTGRSSARRCTPES